MEDAVIFRKVQFQGGSHKLVLSKPIRRALNIVAGDYLALTTKGDALIVKKASPDFSERKFV